MSGQPGVSLSLPLCSGVCELPEDGPGWPCGKQVTGPVKTWADRHAPQGAVSASSRFNSTVTLGLDHPALSEHCWFYFLGGSVAVGHRLDGVQSAPPICYCSSCPETLPAPSCPAADKQAHRWGGGTLPLVGLAPGSGSTSSSLCPLHLSWTCSLRLGLLECFSPEQKGPLPLSLFFFDGNIFTCNIIHQKYTILWFLIHLWNCATIAALNFRTFLLTQSTQ